MTSREIRFIDNRISRIEGRQASSLETSSSQFSPVRVLPNEILSYIFELGALGQEERRISPWHYSLWRVYSFQLLVLHISRHFRNVATSTPRLWTIIHPQGRLELQVDYIKMCLERSGSLPCTISLDYRNYIYIFNNSNPIIDQIMTLVNSNIYRLERFFAKFAQITILDQIMGYLNKPAPLLTALELSHTPVFSFSSEYFPTYGHDLRPLLFDGHVPMLTTLLLEDVYALRRPSYYGLKNLTVLGLVYQRCQWLGPPQEFRTILENSPLLRELSLKGPMLLPRFLTEAHSLVELKFLEHLEMANLDLEDAVDVIDSIAAPNLKTLILAEMRYPDHVIIFDAIVEAPLSFPNLTSLMLVDFETSEEALAKILHAYPYLESLGLYRGSEEESRWMHVLGGSRRLCPNLKTLHCVDVELEEIQDGLARRAEANIPLPKLQLPDSLLRRDMSHNDTAALSWLQENTQVEFLDISLYYY